MRTTLGRPLSRLLHTLALPASCTIPRNIHVYFHVMHVALCNATWKGEGGGAGEKESESCRRSLVAPPNARAP